MEENYKYYAFISYKHEDIKWAKWVQKRLESYRLPSTIRKMHINCPKRVKPICRDNTDMLPGILEKEIQDKLEKSKYLIVICSKNLVKESKYVDAEIDHFINRGMIDRIIPFVVDGEPNSDNPEKECFNKKLKDMPMELLAADAVKDGKYIASLKVIAAILNLTADTLIDRDKIRQKRRKIFGTIGAVLLAILLYIMLGLISDNFEKQAIYATVSNNFAEAIEYSLKSLSVPFNKNSSGEAAQILRSKVISKKLNETNNQIHKAFEITPNHESMFYYGETPDGKMVGFTDLSHVVVYDSETAKEIAIYSLKDDAEKLKEIFGFEFNDQNLYLNNPGYGKEPLKHKEKISGDFIYFYTLDDKFETLYKIDSRTARWTYSEKEDIVAVYREESYSEIDIYSFEKRKSVYLSVPEKYTGISEMFLSPEGRYLFVNFYVKDKEGLYSSFALCVYDIVNRCIVFECEADEEYNIVTYPWRFSDTDKQSFYVFDIRKIEKYSYKDETPDFEDDIFVSKTGSGELVSYKNSNPVSSYVSSDGNGALTVHMVGKDYKDSMVLYNFFESGTGELNMWVLFNRFENIIDVTPDMKYMIVYMNNKVTVYEIDNGKVLYETDCYYDEITSLGISEDGNYAAYINDYGELTVIEKEGASYTSKTVTDYSFDDSQKVVVAVNNERCVYIVEDKMYSYDFSTDNIKYLTDEYGYNSSYSYQSEYETFKSKKLLKDGLLLYVDPVYGEYEFLDAKAGKYIDVGIALLPCAYSSVNGLLAGAEYTNQEQYNNEIVVMRFDKNNKEELYRYTSGIEVDDISFDNEGRYIVINGKDCCEVLDAFTGEQLFTLDRRIRINNGVAYDVSSDLIFPDALPRAEIYSLDDFILEGKNIID